MAINTASNTCDLLLAGAAIAAAVALAAPAGAAVIEVRSNAERSPEYAVTDAGAARLVGTIEAQIGGARYDDAASATTVLPSLRFDFAGTNADPVFRLDPLTLAVPPAGRGGLRFSVAVDLEVDITAASFGVTPDFVFAQGTGPYSSYWGPVTFVGTLSTGADAIGPAAGGAVLADAPPGTAVPEPASFAVLGLGLAGLVFARRRAA